MKTKNAATENLVLDALIIILKRPINMDVKNYSGVYTVFRNYIWCYGKQIDPFSFFSTQKFNLVSKIEKGEDVIYIPVVLHKNTNLKPSLALSSSNWSTSLACRSCNSLILSPRSWRNWLLSSSIFCPSRARRTLTRSSSSRRSRDRWPSAAILEKQNLSTKP